MSISSICLREPGKKKEREILVVENLYYSTNELMSMGVSKIGNHCMISRKCSIYSRGSISIGDNVRIDDFCLLVGNIIIEDYVHIGAFSGLHASKDGHIIVQSFAGVSSNVHIYASSDDYNGEFITSRPGIPNDCLKNDCREVVLGKYSQIGTSSVVLSRGSLGEGTAVGAMSLIKEPLESWNIYAGIPCKLLKARSKKMLTILKEKGLILD